MKKFVKKSFCILLALIMILCAFPISSFAKSEETPIIFVAGIGNTGLFMNYGTEQQKSAFYPEFDWGDVLDLLKGLTHLEDNGYNYTSYMHEVFVPFLQKYMEDCRCDSSGNSVYDIDIEYTDEPYANSEIARSKGGVGTDECRTQEIAAEEVGADRLFTFHYDYRLGSVAAAKNLRKMVENVKQRCNADKVKLVAASMGGTVLSVYLQNYYQLGDTEMAYFLSGAQFGTDFPAIIFSGKLQLNRETIAACLKNLVGIVPASVIGALESTVNQINALWSGDNLTYFYNEWIKPYIGKWLGLWNLIPSDKLDECIDFMLDPQEDSVLISKIREYQKYQDNLPAALKAAQKAGIKVYITSSYNIAGFPFEGNDGQNDIIIDTKYSSIGATVASFTEKTLGDDYKQAKDDGHEHLSCDGIIDASTCVLPEHTWIIKDMMHCSFLGDQSGEFYRWLITSDEYVTVESDEKYPQFMQYVKSSGELYPLEEIVIDEAAKDGDGKFVSSKITTYTYYTLTFPAWLCLAVLAILLIVLIVKKSGNKEEIEGVLTKQELKNLPKAERKAAKKNNKVLIKQYKRDKKSAEKAHKAELKAMPKAERKAAKKADKVQKKANKKQNKANFKARKKQAKLDKKEAQAAKKAGKAPEEVTETKE